MNALWPAKDRLVRDIADTIRLALHFQGIFGVLLPFAEGYHLQVVTAMVDMPPSSSLASVENSESEAIPIILER